MQSTENTQRTGPGPRSHRPAREARPASPELDVAPWWADDGNVDGCEITLRSRSFRSDTIAPTETGAEYLGRVQ